MIVLTKSGWLHQIPTTKFEAGRGHFNSSQLILPVWWYEAGLSHFDSSWLIAGVIIKVGRSHLMPLGWLPVRMMMNGGSKPLETFPAYCRCTKEEGKNHLICLFLLADWQYYHWGGPKPLDTSGLIAGAYRMLKRGGPEPPTSSQ